MSELIHAQMSKVMKSVGSISKDQVNNHQRYKFRGIDDVYNALNKPLSDAGVFYVPRVLESERVVAPNAKGTLVTTVTMKVEYTFYAEDGSNISTVVTSEAFDTSDKATNKALTAALKYMLFQVFCIATENNEDADKETIEVSKKKTPPKKKAGLSKSFKFSKGEFAGKTIAEIQPDVLRLWAVTEKSKEGCSKAVIKFCDDVLNLLKEES